MLMDKRLSVLLVICIFLFGLCHGGKRGRSSDCSAVKESFQGSIPSVAETILSNPQHDGGLELCTFTNHTESKRPSCCSHRTENELLLSAKEEYKQILQRQTDEVYTQLGSPNNLKNHFARMMGIGKRMTEYELGATLNLHHSVGREIVSDFFSVLEDILLSYNRTTSIFKATETMLDRLFVYVIREAASPGSRAEPDPDYAACVQRNREAVFPAPFPEQTLRQSTSIHYSAIAASYLSEALDVMFEALNFTRDFVPLDHCMRDYVKLNHCQKCYGYTEMRPCRYFCEDVFLVCMNSVVWLDSSWEYHRKIVKILSEYILSRVNLHTLLNQYHTELKSSIDMAIAEYPSYKSKLSQLCGEPKMLSTNVRTRLKVWEKPSTTSYEGDFSGDLRKLVVNLELKVQGFFANLHSSICASEPPTGTNCWDGLTESDELVEIDDEEKKKKIILDFQDEFSPYPNKSLQVSAIIDKIKRIRTEVLKIFLKSSGKQDPDDQLEGSGSGDDQPADDEGPDDEDGISPSTVSASGTIAPLKPHLQPNSINGVKKTVTDSARSLTYKEGEKVADNSIELVEEMTTLKVIAIKDAVESSGPILRLSVASLWTYCLLVIFYLNH